MANKNISDLPLTAAVNNDDTLEKLLNNTGPNERVTIAQLAAAIGGGASYAIYRALLTQSGTDAPVATVLENTLGGTVVWTRDEAGVYFGTLAGAFPSGKTFLMISQWAASPVNEFSFLRQDNDSVKLQNNSDLDMGSSVEFPVEILVYP